MDTDEDVFRSNMLDDMPPINCDATLEGAVGTGSNDIGDMTFCMGNYISDFMRVSVAIIFYTYGSINIKITNFLCIDTIVRMKSI